MAGPVGQPVQPRTRTRKARGTNTRGAPTKQQAHKTVRERVEDTAQRDAMLRAVMELNAPGPGLLFAGLRDKVF